MPQYYLDPAQYTRIRKKILTLVIPIGAVFAIILTVTQSIDRETREFNIVPLLIIIPLYCGMVVLILTRVLKRQKSLYDSYRITLHDNLIIREQLNTPDIEIYISEISSMTKTKDNHIIIKGKTPQDVIYIPPQLENFDDLERRLEEIMLIVPATKKTFLQRYYFLIYLLVLASLIVSLGSLNIFVVAGFGIPVIVLMAIVFFKQIQSKNVDRRTKRGLWSFVLLALILIANIIYKWMLIYQH